MTIEIQERTQAALQAVYDTLGERDAQLALENMNPLLVASGPFGAEETMGRVSDALAFLADSMTGEPHSPDSTSGLSWILMSLQLTLETAVALESMRRQGRKVVAIGAQS